MKKLLFIGAGVSTQYGVLHLLMNGYDPKKITIIDKGDSIYDRDPEEVMLGAGGAGTFSDFKVIPSFTQGGTFYPHFCKDEKYANELSDLLYEYIVEFHPDPSKIMYTEPTEEPQWLKASPFELKQSPCYHLGTDYGQKQVRNIFEYFDTMGVEQHYKSEIIDIDFDKPKVIFQDLKTGNVYLHDYEEIIIGTGKSGMDLMTKIINKYNLPTIPKPAQIGVRFETDSEYFKDLIKIAYDFKLYKKYGDDSVRSFCTNIHSAFVAEETTYGMKSYNGHAHKDPEKYNGLVNFGIMIEAKGIEDPFQFSKDLVKHFQKDDTGSYYSPSDRDPSVNDHNHVIPSHKIGLEEFEEGFGVYSEYIMSFIDDLNKTFNINDNYVFYCPEVKFLTNEIVLNPTDLSLPDYPNVHLQGDSATARGIYISAIQGLYVADKLLKTK